MLLKFMVKKSDISSWQKHTFTYLNVSIACVVVKVTFLMDNKIQFDFNSNSGGEVVWLKLLAQSEVGWGLRAGCIPENEKLLVVFQKESLTKPNWVQKWRIHWGCLPHSRFSCWEPLFLFYHSHPPSFHSVYHSVFYHVLWHSFLSYFTVMHIHVKCRQ